MLTLKVMIWINLTRFFAASSHAGSQATSPATYHAARHKGRSHKLKCSRDKCGRGGQGRSKTSDSLQNRMEITESNDAPEESPQGVPDLHQNTLQKHETSQGVSKSDIRHDTPQKRKTLHASSDVPLASSLFELHAHPDHGSGKQAESDDIGSGKEAESDGTAAQDALQHRDSSQKKEVLQHALQKRDVSQKKELLQAASGTSSLSDNGVLMVEAQKSMRKREDILAYDIQLSWNSTLSGEPVFLPHADQKLHSLVELHRDLEPGEEVKEVIDMEADTDEAAVEIADEPGNGEAVCRKIYGGKPPDCRCMTLSHIYDLHKSWSPPVGEDPGLTEFEPGPLQQEVYSGNLLSQLDREKYVWRDVWDKVTPAKGRTFWMHNGNTATLAQTYVGGKKFGDLSSNGPSLTAHIIANVFHDPSQEEVPEATVPQLSKMQFIQRLLSFTSGPDTNFEPLMGTEWIYYGNLYWGLRVAAKEGHPSFGDIAFCAFTVWGGRREGCAYNQERKEYDPSCTYNHVLIDRQAVTNVPEEEVELGGDHSLYKHDGTFHHPAFEIYLTHKARKCCCQYAATGTCSKHLTPVLTEDNLFGNFDVEEHVQSDFEKKLMSLGKGKKKGTEEAKTKPAKTKPAKKKPAKKKVEKKPAELLKNYCSAHEAGGSHADRVWPGDLHGSLISMFLPTTDAGDSTGTFLDDWKSWMRETAGFEWDGKEKRCWSAEAWQEKEWAKLETTGQGSVEKKIKCYRSLALGEEGIGAAKDEDNFFGRDEGLKSEKEKKRLGWFPRQHWVAHKDKGKKLADGKWTKEGYEKGGPNAPCSLQFLTREHFDEDDYKVMLLGGKVDKTLPTARLTSFKLSARWIGD